MRVLFWLSPDHREVSGGHQVQLRRTREALQRMGIDVLTSQDADVGFAGVDVVHAWSLPSSALRRARYAGKPVVVSTIYWGRDYVLGRTVPLTLGERVVRAARLGASVLRRGVSETARVGLSHVTRQMLQFECADLLLPNSTAEGEAIQRELGVTTPFAVVPNGVDQGMFGLQAEVDPRSGVLYVARIEPHKNQLGLIRALAAEKIDLTIVGPVHPHHRRYEQMCRAAAGPQVTFVGPQEQLALVSMYQKAEVHAMPSWFETTGLTSLEAALCGAAVVTTERGYSREYFQDDVEYCNPAEGASIRAAVEKAREVGPSEPLRARILDKYTWAHTAEATVAAYESIL